MPRDLSVPEQLYQPGEYGPYAVDQFTNANTDFLELVLSVVNWPTASPLMELFMRWESDASFRFVVPWVNGQLDKLGNPITEARFRIAVPQLANGKAAVTRGSVHARLFQPIRTAITLQAVQG